MARAVPVRNSFAGGEISPHLDARSDLKFYGVSARLLRNMIVRPQGGAFRRGGTRFINAIKTQSARAILIPFEFSTLQAYMLEAGDRYFRFYKDRGRISVANVATVITNGAFPAGIASWTDRSTGAGTIAHDATNFRLSLAPGGTGATDIGWAEQAVSVAGGDQAVSHVLGFRVIGAPGDFIELRVGTTSTGAELVADRACEPGWQVVAFTPGAATIYVQFRNRGAGNNRFTSLSKTLQVDDVAFLDNAPLEIPTPYLQADLVDSTTNRRKVKHSQSNDVLTLCHPTYRPYKLSRSGHTTWAMTEIPLEDGPYYDEIITGTTLTPSAATGAGVTLTASSTVSINGDRGFQTTDLGRLVRVKEGSVYGWAVIVGWTSTTVVTVDIRSTFTNTNAKATWALGLYSDTDGWPKSSTYFEQRQKLAGASGRPNRWDGSASADFEKFTPGTGDDDAIGFAIASNKVNAIQWMAPTGKLLLGTADECADMMPLLPNGGLFAAAGPQGGVITPTTVEVKEQARSTVLYVQKHGRELKEMAFAFEADGYVAEPMSIRAEHLLRGGLVDMAFQTRPFGVAWICRRDGLLLGFTYLRSQEVTAWHAHPLGGDGKVESIACIPGGRDWLTAGTIGEDEPWMIVERTVNGSTVRYIEILEQPLPDEEPDQIEAFYVDSGLTYDGSVAATLTPGAGATVVDTVDVVFTAGSSVFVAGDVGREIRYRIAADPDAYPEVTAVEARAVITEYTSGTQVKATIVGAFPSLSAIASGAWRMSVTTLSGLSHLEGETVQILADGAVFPEAIVTGGAVTLDAPATYAHVGLASEAILMPTRPEIPTGDGSSRGKMQRISDVLALMHRSTGWWVGRSTAKLKQPAFRRVQDFTDLAVPLETGWKPVKFTGTYDRDADLRLVQRDPLPFNVLALAATITVAEGG